MPGQPIAEADSTAVRTALWRALHVQLEQAPHVLEDEVGLRLAAPAEGWQSRPDMHPQGTLGYRAAIVGRARYIEDLVKEQAARGVSQYVLLGAGLDTFAQRNPQLTRKLTIFEVDKPGAVAWKRQRLESLGYGVPESLRLVPVNFESGESWREKLAQAGFDAKKPAVIASTGVSMYLTAEANRATLGEIAKLAPGNTLAMTFLLPLDLVDPAERKQHEMVYEKARAAGTPFVSFYRPEEILALAREAGFRTAEHVSRADLIARYFAGRTDGFRPASGEEFLVAGT